MAKIRAIIKRPDEPFGHMCNISGTLANLQKTVGGYIEFVDLGCLKEGLGILCNEEGKNLHLPINMNHPLSSLDFLVGTIIVIGVDGEEFTDVPIEFALWKEIVKQSGGSIE